MAAELIDGKKVSARVREEVKQAVEKMPVKPGLATILVGDDPASAVYVGSKRKACVELGIRDLHQHVSADVTQEGLANLILRLGSDPEVTGILLGGSFPLMPLVTLPTEVPAAVLPAGDPSQDHVADWLFQISTVRDGARNLQDTRILAEELENPMDDIQIVQWPGDNKNWIALPAADGSTPAGDLVSIAIQPAGGFDPAQAAALVIDEWSETIPSKDETTGISFHYDAPNAEPPQAVLLAVSQRLPANDGHWTWTEVTACVDQAFLLAQIRGVDPDLLRRSALDPVLPATLAAQTTYPTTISTSWIGNMVKEVAVQQLEILKRT